jgi:magnesium transporter
VPNEQTAAEADARLDLRLTLVDEAKRRPAHDAAAYLSEYPAANVADALITLGPSFRQDILDTLPEALARDVLACVPEEAAAQWRRNRSYAPDTLGRFMEPVYAVFSPQMTVAETVERIRHLSRVAFITYGYVVDTEDRLLGLITMRDLLLAAATDRLDAIMLRAVFSLPPTLSLNDAMKLVLDRHYPVYPVCDEDRRLLGLVRGQAMFEEQAIEITAQVGTTFGVEKEERLTTPLKQSFRYRHPWLQLNLLTAFVAGGVVAAFQDTVDRLVILALFLPVLAGQSGNTGCQALAVTLRGMTLGEVEEGKGRALVRKEAFLGLYNGALTGLVAGVGMLAVALYQGNPNAFVLAIVVWMALVGACVISGICGAMIPLTLKRFGLDPATASSIFLTTATDIVSMGMLLGLATMLVR